MNHANLYTIIGLTIFTLIVLALVIKFVRDTLRHRRTMKAIHLMASRNTLFTSKGKIK